LASAAEASLAHRDVLCADRERRVEPLLAFFYLLRDT
jgi:hypothetical protein